MTNQNSEYDECGGGAELRVSSADIASDQAFSDRSWGDAKNPPTYTSPNLLPPRASGCRSRSLALLGALLGALFHLKCHKRTVGFIGIVRSCRSMANVATSN